MALTLLGDSFNTVPPIKIDSDSDMTDTHAVIKGFMYNLCQLTVFMVRLQPRCLVNFFDHKYT